MLNNFNLRAVLQGELLLPESGVTLALIGQSQTKNDVFWCTEQSISVAFAEPEDYIWDGETSSQFVKSF